MLGLETETEFGSAYLTSMENNGSNGFKITLLSHRDQIRTAKALFKGSEAKFLVISCVGNDKCGGFSQRLRALPFYIFLPAGCIKYFAFLRPFGLDWFLQTLLGGIDWMRPSNFDRYCKDRSVKQGLSCIFIFNCEQEVFRVLEM